VPRRRGRRAVYQGQRCCSTNRIECNDLMIGSISLPADTELIFDGPTDAAQTIALAHGAGVGMDAPFMEFFATRLGNRGFRVARFEFPYMASQRVTGNRRPPDREPVLRETWLKVVSILGRDGLVIGGKSMGGRIASLIADEAGVAGLVCLGYPFHPVDKKDKLRVEHLEFIKTPTFILQGERDPFGSKEEVAEYKLSAAIRVAWLNDGDHNFTPRKSSGRTEQQNLEEAVGEIVKFVEELKM
jgi:predicted alpha/beta-hydrolase family hydrolase